MGAAASNLASARACARPNEQRLGRQFFNCMRALADKRNYSSQQKGAANERLRGASMRILCARARRLSRKPKMTCILMNTSRAPAPPARLAAGALAAKVGLHFTEAPAPGAKLHRGRGGGGGCWRSANKAAAAA